MDNTPVDPVEGLYDVEKIIRKYTNSRTKEVKYLVKWKHFSSKHNTWEPACNFPENLIADYESHRTSVRQTLLNKEIQPPSDTKLNITFDQSIPPSSSSSLTSSCSSSVSKTKRPPNTKESKPIHKRALVRKSTVERRRKQLQLQLAIQEQQKSSRSSAEKLVVFNPVNEPTVNTDEELVYRAELPREPILVTDVTDHDLTVTISECPTSEGFFRHLHESVT